MKDFQSNITHIKRSGRKAGKCPLHSSPTCTATNQHRPRSIARLQRILTGSKYPMSRACSKVSEQGHTAGCQTQTLLDWEHGEEWDLQPSAHAGSEAWSAALPSTRPRASPGASRLGARPALSQGSARGTQRRAANGFWRTGQHRPSRTPPGWGRNHPQNERMVPSSGESLPRGMVGNWLKVKREGRSHRAPAHPVSGFKAQECQQTPGSTCQFPGFMSSATRWASES